MSGIDEITAEILKEAQDKADAILTKAKEQVDKINKNVEEDIENRRALIRSQAEKISRSNSNRLMASAQLTARNRILDAKQDVISTAFENAVKKLLQMPDDEYVKIVDGMVKKIPDSDKMKLEMIPRNADFMTGGFLLKSDDGIILNFSFRDVADDIREKIEPQVMKRLGW